MSYTPYYQYHFSVNNEEKILQKLDSNDEKFDKVFQKLDSNDEKFDKVFQKLDSNDEKFDKVFQKLDSNDEKFDKVFQKLDSNDEKFDKIIDMLLKHESRLDNIEENMFTKTEGRELRDAVAGIATKFDRLDEDHTFVVEWQKRQDAEIKVLQEQAR